VKKEVKPRQKVRNNENGKSGSGKGRKKKGAEVTGHQKTIMATSTDMEAQQAKNKRKERVKNNRSKTKGKKKIGGKTRRKRKRGGEKKKKRKQGGRKGITIKNQRKRPGANNENMNAQGEYAIRPKAPHIEEMILDEAQDKTLYRRQRSGSKICFSGN